jgi:hypothetical protein
MSWATFLWILIVFLLVDAIKTYMEIWRRPKVRDFDTDLSRVTALIPTYNGGKVIGQTLEDLLKMGLSQEQIVADGYPLCTSKRKYLRTGGEASNHSSARERKLSLPRAVMKRPQFAG